MSIISQTSPVAYTTFVRAHLAEIEKLKEKNEEMSKCLLADNEKLKAENEKLFKFITGGGEVEDVEEIIKEKMSKVFIDSNQEHWDQMELFQEEGPRSGNVINTLKEEVDRLEKYNEEYKGEWEDALAGSAPLTMYSDDFTDWENHPFLKQKVVLTEEENDEHKAEVEKLKAEIEKLKEGHALTSEFWECLMDCRGKHMDNPDKQEIDEWCVAYDKSDEIRLSIYEDVGIDEEEEED